MTDVDLAFAVSAAGAAVVHRRFGTALQRLDKGAGDFAHRRRHRAVTAMLALLHVERPQDAVLGGIDRTNRRHGQHPDLR